MTKPARKARRRRTWTRIAYLDSFGNIVAPPHGWLGDADIVRPLDLFRCTITERPITTAPRKRAKGAR